MGPSNLIKTRRQGSGQWAVGSGQWAGGRQGDKETRRQGDREAFLKSVWNWLEVSDTSMSDFTLESNMEWDFGEKVGVSNCGGWSWGNVRKCPIFD